MRHDVFAGPPAPYAADWKPSMTTLTPLRLTLADPEPMRVADSEGTRGGE